MKRLNPFSLILAALAVVSLVTELLQGSSLVKTVTTPTIMIVMMGLSELVRFLQERASRRIYARVANLAPTPDVSVRAGDRISLAPGQRVPADVRLESSECLVVSQSMITGESGAIAKASGDLVYAGSCVLVGSGRGVAVAVGAETAYGRLMPRKASKSQKFDPGASSIALVLIKFMLVLVPVVFCAVSLTRGNLTAAFLFSLSVAVGLTPEMLPLVINACLAKGVRTMGRRETIVRNIGAMQELGGIDTLCIDKTGTLTGDRLRLEYYLDVLGRESARALDLGAQAAAQAGERADPFDAAILSAHQPPKTSEIVLKGTVEEILAICSFADVRGKICPIDRRSVETVVDELTEDGMRVQAVAYLKEEAYVLAGYLAFFDAPKPTARAALEKLRGLHVNTKVLTGDNRLTARSISQRLGFATENLLTGHELESLPEDEFALRVEKTQVFAELTPRQKVRIIAALQENGHAVGFMGDGFNDLPALLSASVAISVDTAAKEVKDISDVVLLRKDLAVLESGILEGRRAFQNMSKYVRITSASNFGNITSIVLASIFLPFFPMTAAQILALNLLYDLLCFILPWDRVDPELTVRPLGWSGSSLTRFMLHFGPVSTLFDLVAFAFLYFLFCPAWCGGAYGTLDGVGRAHFAALFQSGWFLVSLWSQLLILHLLRTPRISFAQSTCSRSVGLVTLLGLVAFSFLPMTSLGAFLGLAQLPPTFAGFLFVDVVLYMGVTSLVKSRYLRTFGTLA